MLDQKQLEVLRALTSTGSTIAAGETLGLSQSGVSRILKQLEQSVGFPLFTRANSRLIPNPEAYSLADEAEVVLLALERVNRHAEDLRTGRHAHELVRIGLPPSLAESFAPKIIRESLNVYPNVTIETFFERADLIIQMIEQRTVDFGFVPMEWSGSPHISVEQIASGMNVCVFHENYAFTDKEELSPTDLKNVPLILIGKNTPERNVLENIFRKYKTEPNIRIETHSSISASAYAAEGLGVAIISSFYPNLYQHLPLVQRKFVPVMHQKFGVAKAANVSFSLIKNTLYEILREQIRQAQALDYVVLK